MSLAMKKWMQKLSMRHVVVGAVHGNCLKTAVWWKAVARLGCWSSKRPHPNPLPEREGII